MTEKKRLDDLMVERGLAETRAEANRLVMAGQVRADGQVLIKSSAKVLGEVEIEVERGPRFVSRGGKKLQAAFEAFDLDVSGLICADVGASTGGFTDCLLQHGAEKVYALDVAKGALHWKLRQDERVIAMEETNARYIEKLPESVSFVTVDVSFISLRLILLAVKTWFPFSSDAGMDEVGGRGSGEVVALIKPQFEAGRREAARGAGVIRDPEIHRRVLREVLSFVQAEGYGVKGLMRSPLTGPKGNIEFLAWLTYPGTSKVDWEAKITALTRK